MKIFKNTTFTYRPGRSAILAFATSLSLWAAATSAWAGNPRFVPNASGEEVTDTQTGLIWRRCSEGQTWTGSTCTGTYSTHRWVDALGYTKSIATRMGVAWRLPNVKELQTLVDRGVAFPAINSGGFPNTPTVEFWTATPQPGSVSIAAYVDFSRGSVGFSHYDYDYVGSNPIRLVRSGQ